MGLKKSKSVSRDEPHIPSLRESRISQRNLSTNVDWSAGARPLGEISTKPWTLHYHNAGLVASIASIDPMASISIIHPLGPTNPQRHTQTPDRVTPRTFLGFVTSWVPNVTYTRALMNLNTQRISGIPSPTSETKPCRYTNDTG